MKYLLPMLCLSMRTHIKYLSLRLLAVSYIRYTKYQLVHMYSASTDHTDIYIYIYTHKYSVYFILKLGGDILILNLLAVISRHFDLDLLQI